jgi:hypothetical protein
VIYLGEGANSLRVSGPITTLEPNTVYHFRIVAANDSEVILGRDLTFTTPAMDAFTMPATRLASTSARLNGVVNPNGSASTVYFEYGLTPNYTDTSASISLGAGTSPVNVNRAVSGLTSLTTYHFRIVASNEFGTVFGANQIFTSK